MRSFDPSNWFWRADDGRVFSSARGSLIELSDELFVAWSETSLPTTWPRDDQGEQTSAALQDVLRPYGIWVDLIAYAADVRWRREVGGTLVHGVPVATDDRAKMMIVGARVAAEANPNWSTIWHGADGNTYPVDVAAMVAISDAVQAHVNGGFVIFDAVKSKIATGEISTKAEVDAAFAGESEE